MAIGFLDLALTAILFHQGLINELNPLMRPLLHQTPWLFIAVKGASLGVSWFVMARYAKTNPQFVSRACSFCAVAYLTLWTAWFLTGVQIF
jgi:hypothetical protein